MRIGGSVHQLWQLMLLLSPYFLLLLVIAAADSSDATDLPQPVAGLSYKFYSKSCPKAESTVKNVMKSILTQNVSEAAGVIRLLFHDCFVQGCDGSILISDTQGEQQVIPNLTLRPSAFAIIEQIKAKLETVCPNTVSCADVVALAAREAVRQAGGHRFEIPTGRRDSLNFASRATVLANLPPPKTNASTLVSFLSSIGLSARDLVSLSGAHTVGLAHCSSFSNRLSPTIDSTFNSKFANSLVQKCPNSSVNVVTNMDILTPNKFDNKYFVNLVRGKVLFTSDATLLSDSQTEPIVRDFAADGHVFLSNFTLSFIKMSMLQVLTGNEGNIRKVCSVLNSKSSSTAYDPILTYTNTAADTASFASSM